MLSWAWGSSHDYGLCAEQDFPMDQLLGTRENPFVVCQFSALKKAPLQGLLEASRVVVEVWQLALWYLGMLSYLGLGASGEVDLQ